MAGTNHYVQIEDQIAGTHPNFDHHDDEWRTIEDLCDGPSAVKRGNERYLPRLSGQQDNEYRSYKDRALFVNFTKRTREALTGMILRKKPKIEHNGGELIEKQTGDITLAGHTIHDWLRDVTEQAVSTGRSCTIIEWSKDENRPFFAHYKATDILNWAQKRINGVETLILLTVREIDEVVDNFTVEERTKVIRYYIPEEGENQGKVLCDVWIEQVSGADQGGIKDGKDKSTNYKQEGETVVMMRNGKPLEMIPAVFHNACHVGPEIGEAPLYDIAAINVSHYRTSADLENGRHICGLPTPYATGVDSGQDLQLGSNKAWTTEEPAAKFGFLEFTGQGLNALENALKEKEKQMATLGARLLYNESKEAEAFETVQIRANSETAALSNIAGHLSATTTQALQWLIWWTSPGTAWPDEIDASILVNTDFMTTSVKSDMLTALTAAYQTGSISFAAYFHNLKMGEIYPPEWDLEAEVAAIGQPGMPAPVKDQGTGSGTGKEQANQGGTEDE